MPHDEFNKLLAKKVLEDCYPDRYPALVANESPDLVDQTTHVGVEVTEATDSKEEQIKANFWKLEEAKTEKERRIAREKLRKHYRDYDENLIGPVFGRSYTNVGCDIPGAELVLQSFQKKVNKLSYYSNLEKNSLLSRYDLFIILNGWAEESLMDRLLPAFIDGNGSGCHYSRVYCADIKNLFVFDLDERSYLFSEAVMKKY